MDKLNYTLKIEEIQGIKEKIREIKRKIITAIKKSNILKRKRIIKKYSTLVQAAILYIVEKLSFQRLSDVMAAKYGVIMSDTAWKKQISKVAPVFYDVIIAYLNKTSNNEKNKVLGYPSYAIDATDISYEGKKGTALRAHTEYDLSNNGHFNSHIADVHTGESVKLHNIKAHSLYFADRAYGRTQQMAYMFENQAEFIFRFSPSQIRLYKDADCTKKINFKEHFSDEGKIISMECFFKHKQVSKKIRVIIAPIPKEKIENVVKKVKRKSLKGQNRLSENTLIYAKWLFLATSLTNIFSSESIISAYRKRWQIELHFKRSKSLLRFHRLRKCSFNYAYSTVFIWLAVTGFAYILFNTLFSRISFDISTFNAFSLLVFLLA